MPFTVGQTSLLLSMPAVRCSGERRFASEPVVTRNESGGLGPARGRVAPCTPQKGYHASTDYADYRNRGRSSRQEQRQEAAVGTNNSSFLLLRAAPAPVSVVCGCLSQLPQPFNWLSQRPFAREHV